jgi:hypothetical protein
MPWERSILSATSRPDIPLSRGILEYFLNFDFKTMLTIQLRIINPMKIIHIFIMLFPLKLLNNYTQQKICQKPDGIYNLSFCHTLHPAPCNLHLRKQLLSLSDDQAYKQDIIICPITPGAYLQVFNFPFSPAVLPAYPHLFTIYA